MDYIYDYTDDFSFLVKNESELEMDVFTELDFNNPAIFRIISGILIFLIIMFGVFGNLVLIYVIVIKWSVQTPFNMLIAHIGIADFVASLNLIAVTISHSFVGEFIYGEIACKMTNFLEYFATSLSIMLIVTALLLLQFQRAGLKTTACAVVLVYLICGIQALVPGHFSRIMQVQSGNDDENFVNECFTQYPSKKLEQIMIELIRVFYVAIPILALIVYVVLWTLQRGTGRKMLRGFVYDRLLIILLLMNIIVWTFNIEMNKYVSEIKHVVIFLFITHVMMIVTIISKPIIYTAMHQGFRNEYQKIVGWRRRGVESHQFI